jgi:hypothetical protein
MELDFGWTDDRSLNLLLGLALAKKLVSVAGILEMRWRMGFNSFMEMTPYFWPLIVTFPPLPFAFWSLLTGSPFHALWGETIFLSPSSPRPNAFWDSPASTARTNVEMPLEASYCSLKKWLDDNLFRLIRTCSLGAVTENSFLVLQDNSLIAICHIIAISTTSVSFQLRCAKWQRKRIEDCHLFDKPQELMRSSFRPCGPHLQFSPDPDGESDTPMEYQRLLGRLSEEEKTYWMGAGCCQILHRDGGECLSCYAGGWMDDTVKDLAWGLKYMFSEFDTMEQFERLVRFLQEAMEGLEPDKVYGMLCLSDPDPPKSTATFAFRFGLLMMFLAASGKTPEMGDIHAIRKFMDNQEQEYVIGPDTSFDVRNALERRDHCVLSLVVDARHCLLVNHFVPERMEWKVFRFQKDVIRTLWASASRAGIFSEVEDAKPEKIESSEFELRRLVVQTSDVPGAAPAYASEVSSSYGSDVPIPFLSGFLSKFAKPDTLP